MCLLKRYSVVWSQEQVVRNGTCEITQQEPGTHEEKCSCWELTVKGYSGVPKYEQVAEWSHCPKGPAI